jgi:hypothetical protein
MNRNDKLKTIPSTMQGPYKKSTSSRKWAIVAFCQECVGYDRDQLKNCSSPTCPLYKWRPYQKSVEEIGDG